MTTADTSAEYLAEQERCRRLTMLLPDKRRVMEAEGSELAAIMAGDHS
jgi:hypothetical protein